jgi:hypothetical protein
MKVPVGRVEQRLDLHYMLLKLHPFRFQSWQAVYAFSYESFQTFYIPGGAAQMDVHHRKPWLPLTAGVISHT